MSWKNHDIDEKLSFAFICNNFMRVGLLLETDPKA